jgi:glycosyltransferase involved in cell wall biosynthesis
MVREFWHSLGRGRANQPRRGAPEEGRVSVVIPLYNHANYIAQAVRSVLVQGVIVRELIVVDDGSRDASASVIRELGRDEPRIIFWSQPNRGAHAAINAGLYRASAELVAILNSDDIFAPGRLQRLARALDDDPGADLAASGISFIDGESRPMANAWYEEAVRFLENSGDVALSLVNGNFLMTTSNFLMRRRVLDEIGCFAPLRYAHDLDYALRLLVRGRRIAKVSEILLSYRMHGSNTIDESHDRVRLEWAAVAAFFLHCLWDRPDSPSIDWARARAFTDLLDKHQLTRPVQLMMAWYRRHPTDTMEHTGVLRDRSLIDQFGQGVR